MRKSFVSLQGCIHNIRSTTTFMLMTINRCIDYTKASKGFSLKPHYETIDLIETLHLPLYCMKNIQNRIEITLNPIPIGSLSQCQGISTSSSNSNNSINAVKASIKPIITGNIGTTGNKICSHIVTDKQWLQENILCLLSNAVKYSVEGNVHVTVSLQSTSYDITEDNNRNKEEEENRMMLRFDIEDTGIGMSEESMSQLFRPFRQNQRLAGGTGLGLFSLAKRVEALQGKYGVQCRRDGRQGSLFWFTIPYRPDYTAAMLACSYDDRDDEEREGHDEGNDDDDTSMFPMEDNHHHKDGVEVIVDSYYDYMSKVMINTRRSMIVPEPFQLPSSIDDNDTANHVSSKPSIAVNTQIKMSSQQTEDQLIEVTEEEQDVTRSSNTNTGNTMDVMPPSHQLLSYSSPSTTNTSRQRIPTTIDSIPSSTSNTTRDSNGLRLLLVDDSPTILKMTSLMLTRLGYHVDKADNGEVALQMIIKNMKLLQSTSYSYSTTTTTTSSTDEPNSTLTTVTNTYRDSDNNGNNNNNINKKKLLGYDLILMDLQMPIMDGLEAVSRLRTMEKNDAFGVGNSDIHHIVVGLSANSDSDTIETAYQVGIDRFLSKPFDAKALAKVVKELID